MSSNGTQNAITPNMIFPQIRFEDGEYAQIKGKLYLFDDFIVLEKMDRGQPTESYIVDPLDVAARLGAVIIETGILPRNCLYWRRANGQTLIMVYVEPKVWPVSIQGEKRTWHVPMPGLIFIGEGKQYTMFAVKGKEYPGPDTFLFLPPCPNVSSRGVCTGNAPFPVATEETIWLAVKAFFESGFNNHLADKKSKTYPENILGQWKKLNKAKATEYPDDDMVPTQTTLKRLIGG